MKIQEQHLLEPNNYSIINLKFRFSPVRFTKPAINLNLKIKFSNRQFVIFNHIKSLQVSFYADDRPLSSSVSGVRPVVS